MNNRNGGRRSFGGGRGGGRGGRGGGHRGGGRGGRGGRGGGGGGGGRHHRGGRGRGGRGGRSRDLRDASISGNKRERIAVESGGLVMIDQFMLANPQFIDALMTNIDSDPSVKDKIIRDFGGCVVDIDPGTYRIERDPFALTIIVHPDGQEPNLEGLSERAGGAVGYVFIDTRCLAMVDRELLDDSDLLRKYQDLWFRGEEKACRDLLRDNGGAVRYGFQRQGDELGVHVIAGESIVCLWPDVAEATEPTEISASSEAA